jgi:hypothetical protein
MQQQKQSETRIAKYVVSGIAIVALVIVAFLDLQSDEQVSPFVYGSLAGGILGAETVMEWFKK